MRNVGHRGNGWLNYLKDMVKETGEGKTGLGKVQLLVMDLITLRVVSDVQKNPQPLAGNQPAHANFIGCGTTYRML